MRNFFLALAAGACAAQAAGTAPQACALEPEHAAILVMQVPAAVDAKAKGGCPAADYQPRQNGEAAFAVRNLCAKSGDGSIGSFIVDLRTGSVKDEASGATLDSPALRTARTRVCSMSVRGVIPSLLPQAHARTRRPARR